VWIDPLIDEADRRRIRKVRIEDLGFGYDPFGLNLDVLLRAYTLLKPVYFDYFRVKSYGIEHVPTSGRVILVANHSGGIPIDGAMIGMDLFTRLDPPRVMRAVVDRFVANLPYINLLFSRVGQIIGIRKNFEYLLKREEMVLVFPEGTPGIVKPWPERYRLRPFNVAFIELHLEYRAPIIPVAVIGAEEQFPILWDSQTIGKPLGIPHVPVTLNIPFLMMILGILGALPFPVQYHIYYGEPIEFYKEFSEDTIRNAPLIQALTEDVRNRIQSMIQEGLRRRTSIFGEISSRG
jgi:1-acyl-sn-glycerol-3-phosphate acyltransferase